MKKKDKFRVIEVVTPTIHGMPKSQHALQERQFGVFFSNIWVTVHTFASSEAAWKACDAWEDKFR